MAVHERRYSLGGLVAANPALAPALLATGTLLALGATNAGFYPTVWYAAGLFLLALLAVTVIVLGMPRGLPRPALAALGLLAAYALWTYISITWASQQGAAWDGANRTALFVVVYALFVLWPFDARGATAVLALLGLGIAGIGLVELVKANAAADPGAYFVDVRFAEPVGYMNANAALWTLGIVACVHLAARRELPVLLRAPALGGAGLLAGLALMSQSRGWVLAAPLALALLVILSPERVRVLAAVLAVSLATLAVSGPVLAVHDDFSPERFDALVADATRAILIAALALAAVGALAALLDRRVRAGPVAARRAGMATALLVALALAGGLAAFTVAEGSPLTRVADAWDDFKGGGQGPQAGASRFAGGGTNRYDFWTVAWELFREEPLRGIGAENFQEEYFVRGSSEEEPLYAHSLPLGVLSQTGLVGALLLFGGLAAALAAALGARGASPPARAAAAGAVALFAYWVLHASVDWFWEFPGLTAPALAALGLAGALAPRAAARAEPAPARAEPAPVPARTPAASRGLAAAGVLAGLALAAGFALPWLAAREVERATEVWRASPEAAYARLDRADGLNPLSPRASLTAGTIALRLDDLEAAEREFGEALEREPRNSYALLELGAIAVNGDERRKGLELLRRAYLLNPRNLQVSGAFRQVRSGRPLDLQRLNGAILRRARRLGKGGG